MPILTKVYTEFLKRYEGREILIAGDRSVPCPNLSSDKLSPMYNVEHLAPEAVSPSAYSRA